MLPTASSSSSTHRATAGFGIPSWQSIASSPASPTSKVRPCTNAAELARLQVKSKTVNKKVGKKKLLEDGITTSAIEAEGEASRSDTTSSLNEQPAQPLAVLPRCDGLMMEDPAWDKEQIEQELQFLLPHEDNIIELLENGLLERVKLLPEEKASRHRRILKKILVKKYFRKADEGHKRRTEAGSRPRSKPTEKTQEQMESSTKRELHDIERLCVRKLYGMLKQYRVEREEAKLLSVQAVRRLQ